MRAGLAQEVITPPLGTPLFGFGGRDRDHGCESVHDDLYVRALYAEEEGESALVLGFDLLFFDRAEADRLKGALGRALDLAPRQILLNCSHTHAGPVTGTWAYADYLPLKSALYMADVERATLRAAAAAHDAARDATLWAGCARTTLPVSRRYVNGEGKAEWRPSVEGEVYDAVPLLLFQDAKGQPLGFLFSVSCHLSTVGGYAVSADYAGAAVAQLNEHFRAPISLFLQGCGGDAKARPIADGPADDTGRASWRSGTAADVEAAGHMVAGDILATLAKGLQPVEPRIVTALTETQWPLQPPPARQALEAELQSTYDLRRLWARRQLDLLERYRALPSTAPVLVQAIRLGRDLRLIALEGEPVAGLGHLIEQEAGPGLTVPLGYSNGQGLYLPTERMLPEGGYEVESAYEYGHPAPLAAGYEAVLRNALAGFHEAGVI